jgi:thiol-disulfide isomerase/thioredoxin
VVKAVTTLPASVANAVGLPSAVFSLPKPLSGQPPLAEAGKPVVVYVGAEFCPFCAAERWAAVMALSRFGTFAHLGETHSSTSDVYPGTVTFSFYRSRYTSRYLVFDPTETNTNQPAPGGGYTALQPLTGLAQKVFSKYDAPPFVPSSSEGSIPFYDFGNKVLVSGASYSPQVLQGLTAQQVAGDLSDPKSPVAQSIVGTANYLAAAICSITSGQPCSVCTQPYVAKAARAMGTTIP